MLGAAHCLASKALGHTGQLEHNASRLNGSNPPLDGTLTGTHTSFGGLLGQRAVREDVDPHLATTLDVTGHCDTSSFDLTVGDVGTLECLNPVIAKCELRAAGSKTGAVRAVLLAPLSTTGNEHWAQASVPVSVAAGASAGAACC